MVIYEVNLIIDKRVYTEFVSWLIPHASQIIQYDGFVEANILEQIDDDDDKQNKITVSYTLRDQTALQSYLTQYASQMREEALQKFPSQFNATRRSFTILKTLTQTEN